MLGPLGYSSPKPAALTCPQEHPFGIDTSQLSWTLPASRLTLGKEPLEGCCNQDMSRLLLSDPKTMTASRRSTQHHDTSTFSAIIRRMFP